MNDKRILSVISVPGMLWDGKYDLLETIFNLERKLDTHFNELVNTANINLHGYPGTDLLPDMITWRQLVGTYIFSMDDAYLKYEEPVNRGKLLPAMCMTLLIWGDNLQGLAYYIESLFIPLDYINKSISDCFYAFEVYERDADDEPFYICLKSLNEQQRGCIAEFIDLYFGLYKSVANDWYTEKHAQAAKKLADIWRNG